MTRPLCGSCPACLEATRGILDAPARPCVQARRVPTPAELERHARRFGPALVKETAEELGVAVKVDAEAVRRSRTGAPTLRERVVAHMAEGRGVELIAELENLSPSRVRRIIKEVKQ